MATAVRVQTLDSGGSPIATVNFEQKEVLDVRVLPAVKTREVANQKGSPTIFIQSGVGSTPYYLIEVAFRIYGLTTTNKFTTIRAHILDGGTVRIYPKMVADLSTYYDCIVNPNILADLIFSGEQKGGDVEKVVFKQTSQESGVSASQDVIIVT